MDQHPFADMLINSKVRNTQRMQELQVLSNSTNAKPVTQATKIIRDFESVLLNQSGLCKDPAFLNFLREKLKSIVPEYNSEIQTFSSNSVITESP
jgi:hypothetical protein